jgi:hypothetical protein
VIETFDLSATKTLSLEAAQPVADLVLREFDEAERTWSRCSTAASAP